MYYTRMCFIDKSNDILNGIFACLYVHIIIINFTSIDTRI